MDKVPGTTLGNYLYTEASGTCNGQEAHLISPCLDLTGASTPQFEFGYHMFGGDMGSLHLDIFADGAWTNDIIPAIVGNQGNAWFDATADLTAWVGKSVKLRLRGITGTSFESDIALDDLRITDAGPMICEAPTGLVAVPTSNSVTVSWTPVAGAIQYNLQGRLSPSGGWANRFIALPSFIQGGLMSSTSYDWRVRVMCADSTISPFSTIETFTTTSSREAAGLADLKTWPVPAQDQINLSWQGLKEGPVRIRIADVLGRLVHMEEPAGVEGLNLMTMSLAHLPAGIYVVQLSDGESLLEDRILIE